MRDKLTNYALLGSIGLHASTALILFILHVTIEPEETSKGFEVTFQRDGAEQMRLNRPSKPEQLPAPRNFTDRYMVPQISMNRQQNKQDMKKTLQAPPKPRAGDKKSSKKLDEKLKKQFKQRFGQRHKSQVKKDFSNKEYEKLLDDINKSQKLISKYKPQFEQLLRNAKAPQKYIYRDRAYDELIAKDVFPTLQNIKRHFSYSLRRAPKDLRKHKTRNRVINDFKLFTRGRSLRHTRYVELNLNHKGEKKGPLVMNRQQRLRYLNNTYLLPKESQLSKFVKEFMIYDPNMGDLPALARELFFENLLRVVYAFSADKSYFFIDYSLENLNKEDYLKEILDQVAKVKGTKTATELLFTVENIYETQQKAWGEYYKLLENYQFEENSDKLRLKVLKGLMQKYAEPLKKRKIYSYKDIANLYTARRIEIMEHIVRTTPDNYRKADALFWKARVHWERGRTFKDPSEYMLAIKALRQIDPNQAEPFYARQAYRTLRVFIERIQGQQVSPQIELMISRYFDFPLKDIADRLIQRENRFLWKPAS